MKQSMIAVLLATGLTFSAQSTAHNINVDSECNISLNNELSISPQHIRIIENDETLVDIYKDQMVFIKGEQVTLDAEQQKLVAQYSQGIREAIPDGAELAINAVNIAYDAIQAAFAPHVNLEQSREKFEQVQKRIRDKFSQQQGYYSFTEGDFNMTIDDEEVDVMVEELIEDMMPNLIGGIFSKIGSAIANGDQDVDFDNFGNQIEKEIESRAEEIEQQAHQLCKNLETVNDIEDALFASNSKFIHLDLLKVEN